MEAVLEVDLVTALSGETCFMTPSVVNIVLLEAGAHQAADISPCRKEERERDYYWNAGVNLNKELKREYF